LYSVQLLKAKTSAKRRRLVFFMGYKDNQRHFWDGS
jgi:hypothetical protein